MPSSIPYQSLVADAVGTLTRVMDHLGHGYMKVDGTVDDAPLVMAIARTEDEQRQLRNLIASWEASENTTTHYATIDQ